MSLDAPKICEWCGENIHTYGHGAACIYREDVEPPPDAPGPA